MTFSYPNLRRAYAQGNLVLYVGAGVSVGSGLPTWQNLVLAMYFSALSKKASGSVLLNPGYLFATAEWHLEGGKEPLEITARKIRQYYEDDEDFVQHLWETLYAGFLDASGRSPDSINLSTLYSGNQTLEAIAGLCKSSTIGSTGVKRIITYNYDSLLEMALEEHPYQSICKSGLLRKGRLPIYHVHGYVPLNVAEISSHHIVFTEDQYHQSEKDAYSWANLVQIQSLSSSVGLMIGLSLADRNMRRLLDAVSQMPIDTDNYALLQEPVWKKPDDSDLKRINEKAMTYFQRLEDSGFMADSGRETRFSIWQDQIAGIIEEVRRVDVEQQTFILEQLGIHPIWYKDHKEIPAILASIAE